MAPPIPPERIESMRCFVHHDHEAVGICRACGKGLCPDCAVDLGHSISCKGACEQKAQEFHEQFVRNEVILKTQKRNRFFGPAIIFAMGVIFFGFGLTDRRLFNFITVFGVFCIILSIILLMLQRRLYKAVDRNLS